MSAVARALAGRILLGGRPQWRQGETVTMVTCSRRTGRPERKPLMIRGTVIRVTGNVVVVSDSSLSALGYPSFWADSGWDTWERPEKKSPWRLFHGDLRQEPERNGTPGRRRG